MAWYRLFLKPEIPESQAVGPDLFSSRARARVHIGRRPSTTPSVSPVGQDSALADYTFRGLGKYSEQDEKLATSAFPWAFSPRTRSVGKAGTHGSAVSNSTAGCSPSPTITGSCSGNNRPRLFAGEAEWVCCQRCLAQPLLLLHLTT